MERLCEECGRKTGPTFYVVEYRPQPIWQPDLTAEKAVCSECRKDYGHARLVTETPAQLATLFQSINREPDFDHTPDLWQISSRLVWTGISR